MFPNTRSAGVYPRRGTTVALTGGKPATATSRKAPPKPRLDEARPPKSRKEKLKPGCPFLAAWRLAVRNPFCSGTERARSHSA